LGARIVGAVGGNWIVRAVLGGLAVVFLAGLVTLPLAAWRERIMRGYGLSTQRWGGWLLDVLKGYAVGAVLGAIALFGFYAGARPRSRAADRRLRHAARAGRPGRGGQRRRPGAGSRARRRRGHRYRPRRAQRRHRGHPGVPRGLLAWTGPPRRCRLGRRPARD